MDGPPEEPQEALPPLHEGKQYASAEADADAIALEVLEEGARPGGAAGLGDDEKGWAKEGGGMGSRIGGTGEDSAVGAATGLNLASVQGIGDYSERKGGDARIVVLYVV